MQKKKERRERENSRHQVATNQVYAQYVRVHELHLHFV